ncbi:MAG: XRE family transcriptional regulator [Oscillospiraceae bacterium]|nr:XRE family transcriptional regulator [Oscillospiraceae bacterium]
MAQITDYGRSVKKRQIDIGQSQEWLASKVREKTGLFCDGGYLYKIFTGSRPAASITAAINEILDIHDRESVS